MSLSIESRQYWTKRDQFKTKEYVYVRYQDPNSWHEVEDGPPYYKPKGERYSCGEVHKVSSWEKAEQKLREIFDRKLQNALDQLKEKKSWYIREEGG